MMCVYAVFEVEDGALPHPYECPTCADPILAAPRRDTRTELLVCWLQLAQGEPIEIPERIPSSVFDGYFAESGYISEEV